MKFLAHFCLNFVPSAFLLLLSAIASWIHSYFDNVMTKFMINNRTDAWKTDVNLLIIQAYKLVIVDSTDAPAVKKC